MPPINASTQILKVEVDEDLEDEIERACGLQADAGRLLSSTFVLEEEDGTSFVVLIFQRPPQ